MKVSVKMLVQLDPGYRHSYGKYPQYALQSKHESKNGAYRRNNYKVLYHRIPSKNEMLKVENKTVIEQTMSTPSIETHLAMVRGLPTKKFLPECVNEKSSTEHRS